MTNFVTISITEICVGARNRLIKKYFSGHENLSVFCVSAKDFQRNVAGYRLNGTDALPLDTDLTEIPRLKKFLAKAASEEIQADVRRHVKILNPGLLNSVDMACSATSVKIRFIIPDLKLQKHVRL